MNVGERRPPVLLADGAFYGTLAAARALGQEGIRVTVADPSQLAPAGWSRHVARRLAAPSPSSGARYMEWLLAFGRREPGHVLLPTSDDAALLYSTFRDELARDFRLSVPATGAVMPLLDKWRLTTLAASAGLDVPRTILPLDVEELQRLPEDLRFPLLLKPRTQALLRGHSKGRRVCGPEELLARWREAVGSQRYVEPVTSLEPRIGLPMVQAYLSDGTARVYGVSGWVERAGPAVLRGSWKLLQRPARLGTGVCFDHAEVEPDVAGRVVSLLRSVGYHGVFEAELLPSDGRLLLIDLNPRFFGQMAFDVARGLPLPQLAYLDSIGDGAGRAELLRRAAAWTPVGWPVYRHRLLLELLLRGRRLSGSMGRVEARRWRAWLRRHREEATDAASAPGDRIPAIVDFIRELSTWVRHPRSSLRTLVLDT